MAKIIRTLTRSQLLALAQSETLDEPVGTIGLPSDSTTEVVIFTGAGDARVVGPTGGTIPTTFTSLSDTPESYGAGGRLVRVNLAGSALEFVSAAAAQAPLPHRNIWVGDLANRAVGLAPGDEGTFLTISGGEVVWDTIPPGAGAATFLELTDTPASFGAVGTLPSVASGGASLEFVTRDDAQPNLARGSLWLGSVSNRPAALAIGANGTVLRSNGVTASWQTLAVGSTTFLGLTDTPGGFGTAGQFAAVNSGENGLEFVTAPTTLPGLTDVSDDVPTAGQGYVYDPDGLGVGIPGFALEAFVRTNLSGSPYDSGRVLQANGTEYADVPVTTLVEPNAEGVMWAWDDTLNTSVEIANASVTSVLRGGGVGVGPPQFEELSDLISSLGLGTLGDADQTLTGSRTVDLDDNPLSFVNGSDFALTMLPGTRVMRLTSRGTLVSDTVQINLDGDTDSGHLDLGVAGNATLRLWNGISAYVEGTDGQFVGHDGRWNEPYLTTQNNAGRATQALGDNGGDGSYGVNFDYMAYVAAGGASALVTTFVSSSEQADSLVYPVAATGNLYYQLSIHRSGEVFQFPSTTVPEGALYWVEAQVLVAGVPRRFVRNRSNSLWSDWYEVTLTDTNIPGI